MVNYEVNNELKKWEERAIFNVSFKENTKANLSRLDEILAISLEHFVMIAANSEPLVYKIARYFITKRVKNEQIEIVNARILKTYIGDDSAEWKKKERCDEYLRIMGEDFKNKWILIPYMDFEIGANLAIYFMSQLRKYSCIGIIFYAEGPSNMIEVLSLDGYDPYFYEYPKKKYRQRKRIIEDDEW